MQLRIALNVNGTRSTDITCVFFFVFPGGKDTSMCDYKDLGLKFLSSCQLRSKIILCMICKGTMLWD